MPEENQVEVSSGNIFADLGLSNPEERLLKAELVRKISEIITNLNLTQVQAAEILGIYSIHLENLSFRLRKNYRFQLGRGL